MTRYRSNRSGIVINVPPEKAARLGPEWRAVQADPPPGTPKRKPANKK